MLGSVQVIRVQGPPLTYSFTDQTHRWMVDGVHLAPEFDDACASIDDGFHPTITKAFSRMLEGLGVGACG